MNELNPDQKYFVDEFYEDYREGLLTRREFIKKLAYIAGSMSATITIMSLLGCSPEEIPTASEPMPTPESPTVDPATAAIEPTAALVTEQLIPVPGAQSPFSVAEGDPATMTGMRPTSSPHSIIFGSRLYGLGVYSGHGFLCQGGRRISPFACLALPFELRQQSRMCTVPLLGSRYPLAA